MSGSGKGNPRPVVVARAVPDERPAAPAMPQRGVPIPLQMSGGRVPEGGPGATSMAKMKSVFEGGGQGARMNAVSIRGPVPVMPSREEGRPVIVARPALGQEQTEEPAAPPPVTRATPPTNIEQVIIRESGPEGLTRKEAADFVAVLDQAIDAASKAISEGQTCIGVDGATIENAKEIEAGLQRFSTVGNQDERLNLRPSEIAVMKSVLECGMNYERQEIAGKERLMAFVAGGLIVGVVALLAMSK